MRGQHDEAFGLIGIAEEFVVTVHVELELHTAIGGKTVDDNLSEHEVVAIYIDKRLHPAISHPPAEKAVGDDVALMGKQHVEGYYQGQDGIHGPEPYDLVELHQGNLHKGCPSGLAVPFLFCLALSHFHLSYL